MRGDIRDRLSSSARRVRLAETGLNHTHFAHASIVAGSTHTFVWAGSTPHHIASHGIAERTQTFACCAFRIPTCVAHQCVCDCVKSVRAKRVVISAQRLVVMKDLRLPLLRELLGSAAVALAATHAAVAAVAVAAVAAAAG